MLVDLNEIDSDPFRENKFDICIIGAGVAGITLALKLSQKLNVVLIEAGGLEYSDDSQAVYKGMSIGQEYYDLIATRLRYFGGTSNHWAGWCRPLDSYDFKPKSYLEFSGWPIERRDLDPYLKEAESILDIPGGSGQGRGASQKYLGNGIDNSQDFKSIEFMWSAPTRFGQKYREDIKHMPNLACYLNANVVDMSLFENLSKLEYVVIRNYVGKTFKVRAHKFVLAAGGIETPRLLLNCNGQIKVGLGNEGGLVGRFFTEHPECPVGKFILEDQVKEKLVKNWVDTYTARKFFAPSLSFMERDRILNFSLRFWPTTLASGSAFKETLRNILCDSEWARDAVEKIRGGKALWCPVRDGTLYVASEQALNPSSRISLGSEVDKFGMRRIVLDWRLSEIDVRTIQRAVIHFGETFASLGLGRVRIADRLLSDDLKSIIRGGNHHMCTTRMGKSPRDGVVDSTQRVFGIDNLYLAGSSVFSTGGYANPTFTIVQMTLRLADHLNGIFKGRIS